MTEISQQELSAGLLKFVEEVQVFNKSSIDTIHSIVINDDIDNKEKVKQVRRHFMKCSVEKLVPSLRRFSGRTFTEQSRETMKNFRIMFSRWAERNAALLDVFLEEPTVEGQIQAIENYVIRFTDLGFME